jgi:dihydroorotate dehydrogenase electron transfer subunit
MQIKSKKIILDLIVRDNIQLNDQYFLLIMSSAEPLPTMYPGQFVEIKVENSPETFLRRPISVNFVDIDKNEMWLLIQKVGAGTIKLSTLKANDVLNCILPLGNTFSLPEDKNASLLLIGGGVGIAPMLFLAHQLHLKGYQQINCLIGGRNELNLLQKDELGKYADVYCTTEDGSFGEKGFVTNHSILKSKQFDHIFTCGPTPMMKAVAAYAEANHINCEVSLENTMACGFGVCLCCITETTEGNLCVCTEGPVFNITKLKW